MIDAFAALVSAEGFILEPAQLNRIRSTHAHFFNIQLFSCAEEYASPGDDNAEGRQKKLGILEKLGVGSPVALAVLAHWILGLSSQVCGEMLFNITGEPANADHILGDFKEASANLADLCARENKGVTSQVKTTALAVLPRISFGRYALFLLFHTADPGRETSPEVRSAAIRTLIAMVQLGGPNEGTAQVDELCRNATHSAGTPASTADRRWRECNAKVALEVASAALEDAAPEVFDAAIAFFAQAFSPAGWQPFLRFLSAQRASSPFETLARVLRAGGKRAQAVLALLNNPELIYLQMARADRRILFQAGLPIGGIPAAFEGLEHGTALLLAQLREHIEDPAGNYEEAVAAVQALALLASREDADDSRKFLRSMLDHFAEQGRSPVPMHLSYDELEAFERAVDPAFYNQFHCEGGRSCTLKKQGCSSPPTNTLANGDVSYSDYVSDSYLSQHCGLESSDPHVCAGFARNRCLRLLRARFPKKKGTVKFLHERESPPWSAAAALKKSPSAPIFTRIAKDRVKALLASKNIAQWRRDAGEEEWAALEVFSAEAATIEDLFLSQEKTYQKKRTETAIENTRAIAEALARPERRLIEALLAAMAVLCVSDITTQEFLIRFFGGNKTPFHWHEPTRIQVISTLAAITRHETMRNGETVFHWLSSVESVRGGEAPAVVAAAHAARRGLRLYVSNPGTEMMLDPLAEQPDDAAGRDPLREQP